LTVTVTVLVAVPPTESVTLTQYVVVDDRAEVVYVLDAEDWRSVPVQLPE
jgi:hypothetical protein